MIRVLVTAFASVPGLTADTAALAAMVGGLRAELDVITLKTDYVPHVERFGSGRMLRVKTGTGGPHEQIEVFARAARRQLEAGIYDVVHVRSPFEGAAVAAKAAELGCKLVYEPSYFPESPELELAWEQAHIACLEAADLVVLPTEAAVRNLTDEGYTGKVNVALPGVNVDGYDCGPAPRNKPARLLYLGSFTADRDLEIVLQATSSLSRDHDIEVTFAGDADRDRRERLRLLVEELGLSQLVRVKGEVTPKWIAALIGASDICLAPAAPSRRFRELGDLPHPLLEYMACRRATVVANVPGVADVLDEGTAVLYPAGSLVGLTDRIGELLSNQGLARRIGEAAYHHVRRHFSGAARRRHLAEIYEQLMPGSQSYDGWKIAFDRSESGIEGPVTGVAEMFDIGSGEHVEVTSEMDEKRETDFPRAPSDRAPPRTLTPPRSLLPPEDEAPKTVQTHLDTIRAPSSMEDRALPTLPPDALEDS